MAKGKQSKPPAKIGRPKVWTTEAIAAVAPEICRRLAEGESLLRITTSEEGDPVRPIALGWPNTREGFPSRGTVLGWATDGLPEHAEFATNYARARDAQAETFAEDLIEIADQAVDRDTAAAQRLKFDARRWIASKIMPKKYGDRVDVTSGGEKVASGVLVVPGVAVGEDWAAKAAAQQKALEEHARDMGESGSES